MDNNNFLSTCKKKTNKQTHNKNKNSKTTLEDYEADLGNFSRLFLNPHILILCIILRLIYQLLDIHAF